MNPLNPMMKLLKAIFFILMPPVHGHRHGVPGSLDVARRDSCRSRSTSLAFGCIVAVFGCLLGAPFSFPRSLTNTGTRDMSPRLYQMQRDRIRTPDVAWQTTQSESGQGDQGGSRLCRPARPAVAH